MWTDGEQIKRQKDISEVSEETGVEFSVDGVKFLRQQ